MNSRKFFNSKASQEIQKKKRVSRSKALILAEREHILEVTKDQRRALAMNQRQAEQAAFRLKADMLWDRIRRSPGAMEEIFKFCMSPEQTTEELFEDWEERYDI